MANLDFFQSASFAGDLHDSKSSSDGLLCISGDGTFVPSLRMRRNKRVLPIAVQKRKSFRVARVCARVACQFVLEVGFVDELVLGCSAGDRVSEAVHSVVPGKCLMLRDSHIRLIEFPRTSHCHMVVHACMCSKTMEQSCTWPLRAAAQIYVMLLEHTEWSRIGFFERLTLDRDICIWYVGVVHRTDG